MKLYRLLEQNEVEADARLPENFGDAYLLKNNSIFRNIRKGAIKSGFEFYSNPNPLYQALPLSQLENIMASKKIPYIDNVQVLRFIEKTLPREVEFREVKDNLRKNFIFHESCHAVARNIFDTNSITQTVLSLLLEESFANTCELFGLLEAADSAHRIFYEFNSYTALFEIRGNLKRICDGVGTETLFVYFMLGYLQSNFLAYSLSDKEFKRLTELVFQVKGANLNNEQLKLVRSLLKICFTLDLEFRTVTTGLHLKLSGIGPQQYETERLEYLVVLQDSRKYHQALKSLVIAALGQGDDHD